MWNTTLSQLHALPNFTKWGTKNKRLPINTAVLTCVKHLTSLEFYHSVCIKNDVVFLLASPLSNTNLRPPLKVIFIGQNINVSFRRGSGLWPNRVLTNAYMHSSVGATVPYLPNREHKTGEMKTGEGVA